MRKVTKSQAFRNGSGSRGKMSWDVTVPGLIEGGRRDNLEVDDKVRACVRRDTHCTDICIGSRHRPGGIEERHLAASGGSGVRDGCTP